MRGSDEPRLPPSKFTAGYTVGDAGGQPSDAMSTIHAAPASPAVAGDMPNPPASASNSLAIASLVTVVLFGVFVVPATIPMGLIARSQIRRRGQSGIRVANAAVAVGAAYALIAAIAVVLWLVMPADVR